MPDLAMKRHVLFQLTLLRMREFLREPEAVFWAFAFPILLTAGLGVAFRNTPAESVHVAAVTSQIAASLRADKALDVEELSLDAAHSALRTGKVALVAEPGPDHTVLYRFDDTNPEGRNARMLVDRAIQVAGGRADPVPVKDDVAREPGSRYIDFLVPGMVGMGIMGNSIWGMGFAIVDSRRRKLMKRIVATPMPRHYYLLSFLIWRMLLLPFEVGIPIGFGTLVFGVPMRGSLLEVAGICVFGSLAFSSLGLLIASRARTIEAATGLMNIIMVPMWIVSGVFFSSQRFPEIVQPLIRVLPLTSLNDALRASMLQGASIAQMAPQLAAMGVCLLVCFTLALKLFRWR
jgi:ABC-type polysaccharide/polyol phosphate export permease